MGEIKLIITDFDGTLVDTYKSNFFAYRKAFRECGLKLTSNVYKESFGLRFDKFMEKAGIVSEEQKIIIKERKKIFYPKLFHHLKLNIPLLLFLNAFRRSGGLVAVASTADKNNLLNVIDYFGILDSFDLILAGEDVVNGKPDPEIYLSVMKKLNVSPLNTLIFEDSDIGIKAANESGAKCIRINSFFFSPALSDLQIVENKTESRLRTY